MSGQDAGYVFQLRRNIAIEGDVRLAEMELSAFLPGKPRAVDDLVAAFPPGMAMPHGFGDPRRHARTLGCRGHESTGPLELLPELVRCLSFVQRIYCYTADTEHARRLCRTFAAALGPVITWQTTGELLLVQAVPHYALIELSNVATRRSGGVAGVKRALDDLVAALTDRTQERSAVQVAERALAAQATTSHLSHDVHYYKAKFFPRLARALVNVGAQQLGSGSHRVLDNFAGSGTTLLEAALLGIPSAGLDIDPLSVLIAKAKLSVLRLDVRAFAAEAATVLETIDEAVRLRTAATVNATRTTKTTIDRADEALVFPVWLMKNRRMNAAIAGELNREIACVKVGIAAASPTSRELLMVLLSDAIARKIRMRFLGTGAGRFALTFAISSITRMFCGALTRYVGAAATAEWLRDTLHLPLADTQTDVVSADARQIPDELGLFDVLVTSPPYMPASSGRESYARARAPLLIALGLCGFDDVDLLADASIGSMSRSPSSDAVDLAQLTCEERDVVDWLRADELRAIKAEPTARYFLDMRAAFAEMHRRLRPGAIAFVVSGKQSTFYRFSTREPLLVVDTGRLLAEEAERAGFELEALHDVQLQKANRNARPRSLDEYYETLIMLRRPSGSRTS